MTFAQAIKAVLPHVSTDRTIHILNHVRVHPGYVEATDRYTAARSTWQYEGDTFEPFLIHKDHAKTIRENYTAHTADTLTLSNGARIPLYPDPHEYPNIGILFEQFTEQDALTYGRIAFHPAHLAKFKAAALVRESREKTLPLHIELPAANSKPVRITFSDHFTGLIAPVRFF